MTCLAPIKDVLGYPSPEKIHHLLQELISHNEIKRCIGLNLKGEFQGIPEYEIVDIHNRLTLLSGE